MARFLVVLLDWMLTHWETLFRIAWPFSLLFLFYNINKTLHKVIYLSYILFALLFWHYVDKLLLLIFTIISSLDSFINPSFLNDTLFPLQLPLIFVYVFCQFILFSWIVFSMLNAPFYTVTNIITTSTILVFIIIISSYCVNMMWKLVLLCFCWTKWLIIIIFLK